MGIGDTYQRLRAEIPAGVSIVLAAKTRAPEELAEAIDAGATDLGHNYVQEAAQMHAALGERARQVRWHMIGNLQTNKINKALQCCDVIQTVDSLQKGEDIAARAARAGRTVPVYVEVNIGREESKAGVAPLQDSLEQLVGALARLDGIAVAGLMTMGPMTGDPEDSRPHFRTTRELFERLQAARIAGAALKTLSMGMSDSYRVAIQEGATMVRLGTIVFGARQR
ncbi:YggS family pyridoxal phosphate-dependent enzyme [Thermodesulfobacteriota bacterium]